MTDIPIKFSMINTNPMLIKKRPKQSSHDLFNNYQRNHSNPTDSTLPIITLSSISNFKEKFIQMASKNKSTFLANTQTDYRMAQKKSRTLHCNRSNPSIVPKSSLIYPTTITRPTTSNRSNNQQQPNPRLLYVVNTPRIVSARISNQNINPLPQQSNLSRPQSQYEHFVTCLRRQTLARVRRKQAQEEGSTDKIQTTVTLNLNKHPSTPSFQSQSNYSLTSLTTDSSSIPTISITAKRAGRPTSFSQQFRRSITNHPLNNSFQQTPLIISKISSDNQFLSLSSPSLLKTPRNSIVDDATMSPTIKYSYESHLNDDMFNYCDVSGSRRVKYQGQMLSTVV